jgi:hypothetical protein
MIESSHCFWKCDEIQDEDFWVMVCPDFGWVIVCLSMPTIGRNESVGSHGSLSLLFVMKVTL